MRDALAFSGGKDSWACLWLWADRLAGTEVIWVNPGKNYPELLATVERARAMCPNFHEVRVDRDAQNARWGLPSEIVPVDWTVFGQQFTGAKPVSVQPYLACCYENIGRPLHEFAKSLGCTRLIRGQRSDESHTSTARDGDLVDGLVYVHPIETWSRDEVFDFLRSRMEIPGHFALQHSSMDCYDCTAYRAASRDRIAFMHDEHPVLFREFAARKAELDSVLQAAAMEN